MTNKVRYIDFCKKSGVYIPIFSQPWWLEAVSYGNWDALVVEESGNIIACNPFYYIDCDYGREILKAPLTQNNGVLFNYPVNMKYVTKLAFERKILDLVIDQIEAMNLVKYRQYFHYSFTNWLPYYWRGFSQTTRYTYVIEETNMDVITANMDSKLRNQIRKAHSIIEVKEGMLIDEFYEFHKKTYERQDIDIPYQYDIVRRIEEECAQRSASKILYAMDKYDNIHAAIYLVEDAQSVYYLLSGSDEKFRNSQSLSLLIKEGIEYAISKGKKFDFEGSMKKNLEKNFSQFGGIQKPYMNISKTYSIR